MEQESQALITSRPFLADFDASSMKLKSKLARWIGKALAARDRTNGLSLLCRELELQSREVSFPCRIVSAKSSRVTMPAAWFITTL